MVVCDMAAILAHHTEGTGNPRQDLLCILAKDISFLFDC